MEEHGTDRLVVLGVGYVGLPLAQVAVRRGMQVAGFDIDEGTVMSLNAGTSHVDDLSDDDVRAMLDAGFTATSDPTCLEVADVAVICVPTPLGEGGIPDLTAVLAAGETIAAHLRPETLVVLQSTTYPGTTEDVLRPVLERSGLRAGRDFALAYAPERIDPGNPSFNIVNTPKVVGGYTPACCDRATAFFGRLVDEVVPVSGTREAELAKLLENTYRHVNIALVNELAVLSDALGVDLWEAIRAASTKPFGYQAFYPGPGVGGHCIPIDPSYLSFKLKTLGFPFRFVELAQEINGHMPSYVINRIVRALNARTRSVRGSRVLLLGITYKPDVSDLRETPALPLAVGLLEMGATLGFHDPHVDRWDVDGVELVREPDLWAAVRSADLVVLLQAHRDYDLDKVADGAVAVLDTRGRMYHVNVERL